MCANNWVHYGLIVVYCYLHITPPYYHHYADLEYVCLNLVQFSQLSLMQYMGLCVFSLPIPHMIIVEIPVLDLSIIIKSDVWSICHCLWLGHETMLCAVCLSMFFMRVQTVVSEIHVQFAYASLSQIIRKSMCKSVINANMDILIVLTWIYNLTMKVVTFSRTLQAMTELGF